MSCQEVMKHSQRAQAGYDFCLVSMELLAAKKEESRKSLSQGKMDQWLEGLTARATCVGAAKDCPDAVIPSYSRNVTVRFEDPEVRKKLMRLINTDVIKIMDKDFMSNLQNKLYQCYWEAFDNRLADRRQWELQRRKTLALDGIQPMDDKSLDRHPVITVRKHVDKAMETIGFKKPYQTRSSMAEDYEQFMVESYRSYVDNEKSDSSDEKEELIDLKELESQRKKLDVKFMGDNSLSNIMSENFYRKIKYEPPLIKDLRAAQSVKDLYSIAEKLLKHERDCQPLTEEYINLEINAEEVPQPT